MMRRFLANASSISSSAWATVAVNGFSTKTCLPFSRAFLANGKWCVIGVTMATASISGLVMISAGSVVTAIEGYVCLTRCRDLGFRSQTDATVALLAL